MQVPAIVQVASCDKNKDGEMIINIRIETKNLKLLIFGKVLYVEIQFEHFALNVDQKAKHLA